MTRANFAGKSWLIVQFYDVAYLWLQNLSRLRDWLHWDRAIRNLDKSGLGLVFDEMQNRQMSGKEMADVFRCSLLHSLAERIIGNDTALTMFHGLLFEQQIAEYRRLTSAFQDLSQRELVLRLDSTLCIDSARLGRLFLYFRTKKV